MIRILLVEDEKHLAEGLAFNLRNVGYDVKIAGTAPQAIRFLDEEGRSFDLVILDVMLPGGDGLDVARRVRRTGNLMPILFLTARTLTEDVIAGLDAGGDEYLTKPYDLEELLARLRVLLRRQAWSRAEASGQGGRILEFGDCRVDFQTFRALTANGEEVQLGRLEAMLLRALAAEEGNALSRARLLEEVWGAPGDLTTRTVDNFILRLRRYFEADPSQPKHIQTVRGVGYRFVR
ncbi:MAG: response regulator transcription factor [Planctomycetes bacterium]|nr:response regulator transcription factor [Planctomycetota bacterium]